MGMEEVTIYLHFLRWNITAGHANNLQRRHINVVQFRVVQPFVYHKSGRKQDADIVVVNGTDKLRMHEAKECQYQCIRSGKRYMYLAGQCKNRAEVKQLNHTQLLAVIPTFQKRMETTWNHIQ